MKTLIIVMLILTAVIGREAFRTDIGALTQTEEVNEDLFTHQPLPSTGRPYVSPDEHLVRSVSSPEVDTPRRSGYMPKALEIIKRWEDFRSEAYRDGGGVWTVGWGTTTNRRLGVTVGKDSTVTRREADEYLIRYIEEIAEPAIDRCIKVSLTDNQRAALISFVYNGGGGWVCSKKSSVKARLNRGDYAGAAEAMSWYNKDNRVFVRGLANRRADEIRLFKR
jgi:lysozyme